MILIIIDLWNYTLGPWLQTWVNTYGLICVLSLAFVDKGHFIQPGWNDLCPRTQERWSSLLYYWINRHTVGLRVHFSCVTIIISYSVLKGNFSRCQWCYHVIIVGLQNYRSCISGNRMDWKQSFSCYQCTCG